MPPVASITLLTIEDDPAVRQSLVAFFRDSGFAVLEAADGDSGLDQFRRHHPDIVLTDLRMPGLDGQAVAAAVRAESPETPVIVVSGLGVLEDAIEAVRHGAWDYITKPILDLAGLEITINKALERSRLLRENRAYQERLEHLVQERTAELSDTVARLEEEIAELDPAEKGAFLAELGIKDSGLDQLVKACYRLLGLISYLTAGPKEVRAWTITRGTKAPQAAGKIHTDFERGFIRAEIVPFHTLQELGSMTACKEKGLVRSEGKEYVMQDGDVTLFRINV